MSKRAAKHCIECNNPISQKAKRCRECFHKSTRGRTPHNKGKRTAFVVCVDCGKKSYHQGKTFNYTSGIKTKWLRCRKCANVFVGNKLRGRKVINLHMYGNKNRLGKKHSEAAKRKMSLKRIGMGKGEKNGNWRGGVTELRSLVRHLPEYNKWRKSIFEQDDYTCVFCGERGCYLEADHFPKMFAELLQEAINKFGKDIERIRKYKPLFEAEGRTVCKKHHKRIYVGNQHEGGLYL